MKKFNIKKVAAVVLSGIMVLSMTACGEKATGGKSGGKDREKAVAVEVTEPVTIEFWHTRGSGANGTHMEKMIERFNAENELGITVKGTYMGDYVNCTSKAYTAMAAGNNPAVIITNGDSITNLAEEGVLADMTPYIERDGFDIDNIPESLQNYMEWDGEILSFPYAASTPVFYYNKALWTEGAPTSLEDLAEKAKRVKAAHPDVDTFSIGIDVTFLQRPMLMSLGATGVLNATGDGAGCLEDGSMQKLLTDWLGWIEEGWCVAPSVSSAGTKMTQDLLTGKLAAIIYSTGSMNNIFTTAQESNVDIGVSPMVGYGGYAASVGGGHLVVLERNKSDQEISAAWEFVKFLMDDQQVAENHADTGYLPVTKSSTETDTVKNLWAAQPAYKVGYDQLEYATYNIRSNNPTEWNDQLTSAISYVVQDRSMTPEEAVDFLKTQEIIVFDK